MKLVIYQVFTRTFGNKNTNNQPNGTIADNGVGKMSDFNKTTLQPNIDYILCSSNPCASTFLSILPIIP